MTVSHPCQVGVTGIGILSPFGIGVEQFWPGVLAGVAPNPDVGGDVEASEQALYRVPSFTAKDFLPRLRPPYPPRYSQLALVAAALAIDDAGLDATEGDRDRLGTIVTTDFGPNAAVEKYLTALFTRGAAAVSPIGFASAVANVAVGDIARYWKLRGASSLLLAEESVCYAFELLRDARADVIICGGVDELRDVHVWTFTQTGALAPRINQAGPSAYDSNCKGIVLGEAAAFLVLERIDHAQARKAHVYATILSYGAARDRGVANGQFLGKRSGTAAQASIESALLDARVVPGDVGVVVGAATTYPESGQNELAAFERVWSGSGVDVTNVKRLVGETFGASGVINLATAALVLSQSAIPPATTYQGVAPSSDNGAAKVVRIEPKKTDATFCVSTSIRIGGNDTAFLLEAVGS